MEQTGPAAKLTVETDSESVSVELLREQLEGVGDETDPGQVVSQTISEVETGLFGDEQIAYDKPRIKFSLDELLVALVALRETDTHGKQLMSDLNEQFDTSFSPGTVYPRLHALCEAGVLDQCELIRTKEYSIEEAEAARSAVVDAARQHIALGVFLQTAVEDDIE